ncbi:MAG: tyrosine-type recombinase/integrase [Leptothrix sp. (in: b-proteobacteria)]
MALTDIAIRKARPLDKTQRLFDAGGLYLEVAPSGGKWWRLKYRIDGKEKRISLGTFPAVSLKEAREARDRARSDIAAGRDPSIVKRQARHERQAKAERVFETVARQWLVHRASAWTVGTLAMIRASFENHVFPHIGALPVDEVEPRQVREVVKSIEAAGASETAGRVFQRIRAVYRYAIANDLAKEDPTYPLKPMEIFKPRITTHRASLPEADMPVFLRNLHAYEGDPRTQMALELLILTAVRPGELRGIRFSEIDEQGPIWRIPGARMKMKSEHLVSLSRQALTLIQKAKPFSDGSDLLFPSPYYPGKPLSDGTLNSALARLGYKGRTTAHGFRTVFSTAANEAGWRPDVIERQLAHEERDAVRAAYNRAQWLDERRSLLQWWADKIDEWRGVQCKKGVKANTTRQRQNTARSA